MKDIMEMRARNLAEDYPLEEAEGIRATGGCPALERHGCSACRLCNTAYCFGDHLVAIRMETEALEDALADPEPTPEDERAAIGHRLGELDMRAIQLKAFAKTHPEVCERKPGYTRAYLSRLLSEVF